MFCLISVVGILIPDYRCFFEPNHNEKWLIKHAVMIIEAAMMFTKFGSFKS